MPFRKIPNRIPAKTNNTTLTLVINKPVTPRISPNSSRTNSKDWRDRFKGLSKAGGTPDAARGANEGGVLGEAIHLNRCQHARRSAGLAVGTAARAGPRIASDADHGEGRWD